MVVTYAELGFSDLRRHRIRHSALIEISSLPALNATLNALATVFLVTGYVLIRRGHATLHQRCMIARARRLDRIPDQLRRLSLPRRLAAISGTRRAAGRLLAILATHIPLAALIVPLALLTASRGLRGSSTGMCRIARWTLPLWLYVSVTGVVIYFMLYHLS